MKLMISAPSNGGCDELARRIIAWKGKKMSENNSVQLNIVRVGRLEKIHDDCDDFVLDNLVKKKLGEMPIKGSVCIYIKQTEAFISLKMLLLIQFQTKIFKRRQKLKGKRMLITINFDVKPTRSW